MIGSQILVLTLLSMMGFEKIFRKGLRPTTWPRALSADNELEVVQLYGFYCVVRSISSACCGLRNKRYTFAIRAEKGVRQRVLPVRQTNSSGN